MLNTASFNTEIWRSAYQSFPQSQIEAARAMGMTRGLYFRRIMLPQMWYTALPPLVNEMTFLIKASPAIAVIGIVDLTRVTNRISRSEEHTSELQSLMRISYAVFCLKKKKT